jgi:hypothetical protein
VFSSFSHFLFFFQKNFCRRLGLAHGKLCRMPHVWHTAKSLLTPSAHPLLEADFTMGEGWHTANFAVCFFPGSRQNVGMPSGILPCALCHGLLTAYHLPCGLRALPCAGAHGKYPESGSEDPWVQNFYMTIGSPPPSRRTGAARTMWF